MMCRVLEVSRSGYYGWIKRQASVTEKRRAELAVEIQTIHTAVKQRYGSPRMHAELVAKGLACSVNTVAKIMKQLGIQAISHKKFRVSTTDSNHDFPVAANLVNRNFTATKPNEIWLADITYIPTQEGWLYLAAVEDLYSRRVDGWSMGEAMPSRLVVDALKMAVKQRFPDAGLVVHSDRGSQYASEHYQRALAENGITCSMSGKGDCYDNAPMESFFASMKTDPFSTTCR
jgi:putative transposase